MSLPRLRMSAASTEYVRIPVSAVANGASVDVTLSAVALAFITPDTTPITADWQTGTWETEGAITYARVLVGPANSGVTLTAGHRTVWLRLTGNPEVPVRPVATLTIH